MSRCLVGRRFGGLAALVAGGLFATAAHATPVTLTSQNSSAVFGPASVSANSSWIVDGTNQVAQTGFWIAPTGGAPESLSAVSTPSVFSTGGILQATYAGDGFNVVLNVTLTGGTAGSGASAMNETVTFNNTSGSSMSPKFYEYEDFTLNNSGTDNTLTLSGSPVNTATQTDPAGTSMNLSATGGASAPDFFQTGTGATIADLLNGSSPVTLNNNSTGPLLGDPNFAFEFDPTVGVDGSFQISVNKTIQEGGEAVPLPSAAPAAAALLVLLTGIRVARKAIQTIA
ncbi:MAG: hypothetical protein ABSF29_11740 [Tepidisphaeraceae bacterium]|jgi:hypothetical protein